MAPPEKSLSSGKTGFARRDFLACLAGAGLSGTVFCDILWAKLEESQSAKVTEEMLAEAEQLAGLEFDADERKLMLDGLNRYLKSYQQLREVDLDNSVGPAVQFSAVLPDADISRSPLRIRAGRTMRGRQIPSHIEQMAFWSVGELSQALRSRKITSVELTRMYLERLKRLDGQLKCVITYTEELAMKQARRADEQIAAGRRRGPLHGIPWGAKDLLAVKGYKTTWGAAPYKDQVIDIDATVVERLDKAGAVLVAKLTLGALAMGDVWYGGMTRNPWNVDIGSSGSSAGPAAATAAGCVGFSIGSETLGSIVSPCTVCGLTGLRPTFGRVSRHGAMALSWSMDKIGPLCRTVEDCGLVFEAIHGPDGKDPTVYPASPFNADAAIDLRDLKIGYLKADFEADRSNAVWKANDLATLDVLRKLGFNLVEIELPDLPVQAMRLILYVEAAAAFDELTRSGRDQLLVRQSKGAWPNIFRKARMVPAVEYIQANRVRTLLMRRMNKLMSSIDVYVAPSWVGKNLTLTNLTGHPAVVLPNGFDKDGLPTSITFTGNLFEEATLLAIASKYQTATEWHKKHPKL